jgi:Zinc finger, C3HC4 type (RING finger)
MSVNMTSLEDANEEQLCLICMAEFRNLVNLPCGHSCIGDACVKVYFESGDSRACPLCRKGEYALKLIFIC